MEMAHNLHFRNGHEINKFIRELQYNLTILFYLYAANGAKIYREKKTTELWKKRGEKLQINTNRIIEFVIKKCLFATSQKRIIDNKKSKYA